MNWVTLALLSAFFLASADALTKKYLSQSKSVDIVLIRFGISGLILLPVLIMQPWPHLSLAFWGWMSILIPLEITAMLLYMRAITASPLALTLPYLAFTPAFNTLTGYLILGETVSLSGFAGIMLIVSGAWLLNLEFYDSAVKFNVFDPFRAIFRQKGARLMLLVAVIYSATSVMGKAALQFVTPAFFGPFYFVSLGLVTTLLFLIKDRTSVSVCWRHPWISLLLGGLMAGMVMTHFYALSGVEVAYMIAVKRTSLLFGILFGVWLFGEKSGIKNFFAGGFMVLGVFFIVSV